MKCAEVDGKKDNIHFLFRRETNFPFLVQKKPFILGGVGVQNEGQERSEKCLFE